MKNRKSFTVCFTTGHTSSEGKTAGASQGKLTYSCHFLILTVSSVYV